MAQKTCPGCVYSCTEKKYDAYALAPYFRFTSPSPTSFSGKPAPGFQKRSGARVAQYSHSAEAQQNQGPPRSHWTRAAHQTAHWLQVPLRCQESTPVSPRTASQHPLDGTSASALRTAEARRGGKTAGVKGPKRGPTSMPGEHEAWGKCGQY